MTPDILSDTSAATKPLLHLWSLGIEEQFYIVWPVLLWAAWRRKLNLLTITLVVATVSFALNITRVHSDSAGDFYSPQTRFWELLIGSTLAWLKWNRPTALSALGVRLEPIIGKIIFSRPLNVDDEVLALVQSVAGAALIVAALTLTTGAKAFPGWWALLPTLGTALLISAGPRAWVNRTILSNRILVWVGLISFPLYLWHWPLLAFARITDGDDVSQASGSHASASPSLWRG